MADSESPASSAAAWLEKGKAAIGKDKEGGGKDKGKDKEGGDQDKGKGNDPGNDFEKDAKRLKQGGGSFLFLSGGSRAAAQKALNTSPILVQSSSDGDASGDFGPSDDEPAAT
jgi:hypothetical protein